MSGARFEIPPPGAATPVRFPPIDRITLASGMGVWTIARRTVPAATVALVIRRGTADDPDDRHGLASLTGDLLDEGAGTRSAIELADAFGRMGVQFDIDVGPDATVLTVTTLTQDLGRSLGLLADVVMRPHLAQPDFERVRDLRLNRLRQLSRSAGALADRTYVAALFGRHAYGHGAMGTTASLEAISVDDARGFWAGMYGPHAATLIVGGDVTLDVAARAAAEAFDGWQGGPFGESPTTAPVVVADPRVLLVDRPGAPQSELRLGHVAPSRSTKAYHALVTVNALLGGQFTSRLNRRLREEKGVTYGARTAFDLRRVAGTFSCETSVQADATAGAVADVLEEFADVSRPGAISAHELGRAKASLTRGYVRSFETAGQLVRAAAQLVTQGLPDDTFDRFVPAVEAVTPDAIHAAAREHIRTAEATVVVVGDASQCEESLRALGRPLDFVVPVF